MTPVFEVAYGMAWRELCKREGHKSIMPIFVEAERSRRVMKARDRVAEMKAQGYTLSQIARRLRIKLNTVKTYDYDNERRQIAADAEVQRRAAMSVGGA